MIIKFNDYVECWIKIKSNGFYIPILEKVLNTKHETLVCIKNNNFVKLPKTIVAPYIFNKLEKD